MRPSSPWMWASLLLTLMLGICVGVIGERYLSRSPEPEVSRWNEAHWSFWFDCDWVPPSLKPSELEAWRASRMARLRQALDLDAEQVAQVETVWDRYDGMSRDNWTTTRKSYCGIRDALRADLRGLLRKDQLDSFDRYLEQIDERTKRYWNRGTAEK